MSINQLILRSLKKNLKNYYLYVFALIFSAALYFAFVTMQYDPSMDPIEGGMKGQASIKAASVLLVAIVSIFLLYANMIFIKRRSKEIGLYQLIGMTKNRIFRILSAENFILYFGSIALGILAGFLSSKLLIMILFKITGVDAIATLHFQALALIQTLIVFAVIYVLIMLMNYSFIKRQSILSLFHVRSSTESKVRKISFLEMSVGLLGLILIVLGYYISSKLFSGDFATVNELFAAMIFILASVIIGTYLFYKGSVSFIFSIIRKGKQGYLNINEVLSLSSIMFRMKSNAFILTVITTISALSIGLLCLTYISYYSAEKAGVMSSPTDFSFIDIDDAGQFKTVLDQHQIEYTEKSVEVIQVETDLAAITDLAAVQTMFDLTQMSMPVISEQAVSEINVSPEEVVFIDYSSALGRFVSFDKNGPITFTSQNEIIPQQYIGLRDEHVLPNYFSAGFPTAVVDETVFERLKQNRNQDVQEESSIFVGIDLTSKDQLGEANILFDELNENMILDHFAISQLETSNYQKQNMGLIMFVVGFLGLTFLITSGCILYFKQMDESEDEKASYTILRKLGFTQGDLLRGIQIKQLYNFGIPLIVGLSHSYFAVQSGWFLFGTELWTPMIIVMAVYTVLYSIFGILSVFHYKKVIKDAL